MTRPFSDCWSLLSRRWPPTAANTRRHASHRRWGRSAVTRLTVTHDGLETEKGASYQIGEGRPLVISGLTTFLETG